MRRGRGGSSEKHNLVNVAGPEVGSKAILHHFVCEFLRQAKSRCEEETWDWWGSERCWGRRLG
jgi:hypothetical protein